MPTTAALQALARSLGCEVPLDVLHGEIRRAAQSLAHVAEYGMCLITCSDEFQGELRANFDRDVAAPLMSSLTLQQRRVFTVSNLGGRVEPGALELANDHFTVRTARAGAKALVVEIAAHVGRVVDGHTAEFGTLDRFGVRSPCCGALTLLLEKPRSADTVRYPWFEQLSAFFGSERLATLRADTGPLRLVRTAVVHAVLQVETAIVDLLRDPPRSPTHVLVAALVIVNQRGADTALLVGAHHLHFDGDAVAIVDGMSLRARPDALVLELESGRLRVSAKPLAGDGGHHDADLADRAGVQRRAAELGPAERALRLASSAPPLMAEAERVRSLARALAASSIGLETYARPILRSALQRAARTHPEFAAAVLFLTANRAAPRATELHAFFARHASEAEAQRMFQRFERELFELDVLVARAVLGYLFDA
ncbi:MAG: hypothetical protein HZA52_08970 [Planctomycetes bacterium]|nr:hypothetical protein [Planctomycetota bacterium]